MPFNNTVATFYTDPGHGRSTSKYYTYLNGTIRAKFAADEIHLRPGKNICFVGAGVGGITVSPDNTGLLLDGNLVTFATLMTSALYQTVGVGARPIDFYLNGDDTYRGGLHRGHAITAAFAAQYADIPINEATLDLFVTANYVDPTNAQQLSGVVNVADIPVAAFFNWVQMN